MYYDIALVKILLKIDLHLDRILGVINIAVLFFLSYSFSFFFLHSTYTMKPVCKVD